MLYRFIKNILILLGIDLQNYYLDKASAKAPIKDAHGNEILLPPLLYGIYGLISFAIGLAVLIYGLLYYSSENINIQIFVFILFGGIGIFLILHHWVTRILLTEKYIISISMLGRRKDVLWKHICKAVYNNRTEVLKIQTKGTTINCHRHMVGFPILIDRLEKELKKTKVQIEISKQ